MGVGTSKGTESSGLRAWSVSWSELYHVNEKRLIKDMTQYQDTTENIWGVVRSCAPLTFSPLKHPTAMPVAPSLIGISRESRDWSGGRGGGSQETPPRDWVLLQPPCNLGEGLEE